MAADKDIQISVVIPCFNEEKTVGETIAKAKIGLSKLPFSSEILLIDNNSTDNSAKISSSLGAKVVFEHEQGYGYALLRGFEEAKGRYIIMGDADNTYDLSELDKFIKLLMEGYDLVTGTRLKGDILPGAMKWLHRYIGNPLITFLINLFSGANVSDAECGMRAFTKEAYRKMHLQAGGMELISEMIVKAAKTNLKIIELPITYYPRKGESKLRSFSDGWRNMRFLLLYSPTYLFLIPGEILFSLGFILMLALLPGPLLIGGHGYDIHVMVLASTLAILGYQIILLGLYAKIYSLAEGFEEDDKAINLITKYFTLEKGLYAGTALFLVGLGINMYILVKWISSGFGQLAEIRAALVALTLIVIGIQTIFSSFFLSLLLIRKAKRK